MKRRFDIDDLLGDDHFERQLRADVVKGLASVQKTLPPKWFYDEEGGRLFEKITRLPEYYPSRAEREILLSRAELIAGTGTRSLIELGSGSSEKTRILLDALRPEWYVPVDVSRHAIEAAGAALGDDYPDLAIKAVVGDFQCGLRLPQTPAPRLLAFLGGTVGNLLPAQRERFLASTRGLLERGDALLLGADLVKDEATLLAAYDDDAGVTAEFDKNVLKVMNRRLRADFDPDDFEHVVRWDKEREWVEMRLRALRDLTVTFADLGLTVAFEAGEDLLTEISAKFRPDALGEELARAGFEPRHWWTDVQGRYGLCLAVVPGQL